MSEIKVQVLEGKKHIDLAKLEDVLSRKLLIPSYQRPYAWESEDIEEIFNTISPKNENEDDNKNQENTDGDNIYFFGSIILSRKNGGHGQEAYHIIDGQQRLISFLLILRVILNNLNSLSKTFSESQENSDNKEQSRKPVIKEKLKQNTEKILKIIEDVDIERELSSNQTHETSIIHFIKDGQQKNLSTFLKDRINKIYECQPILKHEDTKSDALDCDEIEKIFEFLDFTLNKIRFCLICITGEDSESFAINLFNTLNTTGEPLTAFEVLKSKLRTIDEDLEDKINEVQNKVIDKYKRQRKNIVSHTGKLLLYLPLYRGDFKKQDKLSDKDFKEQRKYLNKHLFNKESAKKIVEHIEIINDFYSDHWLKPDSALLELFNKDNKKDNKDDVKLCFQFLSKLKHDRVLPILIRFYKYNKDNFEECIKSCTAFSSLWRAFNDGGTSGIDNAYKKLSLKFNLEKNKGKINLEELNKEMQNLFNKKISSKNIKESKAQWIQKLKTSTVYDDRKNQKLSKFLLFLSYNERHFDKQNKKLEKGNGPDILNLHYWQSKDYQTIEHIIPQSDKDIVSHVDTLGNLTLLPQDLNSSLGDKPFKEKCKQYKKFCSENNQDKYPYLPLLKHIASYEKFEKSDIEDRSEILAEFIWETLAEDWLGWTS